jgi:hypothetical protein
VGQPLNLLRGTDHGNAAGSGYFLNFGAGPTVWKYLSMEYKGMKYDDNLLDGPDGTSVAVVGRFSIEWFYLEGGVSGPDFLFGLGFSI